MSAKHRNNSLPNLVLRTDVKHKSNGGRLSTHNISTPLNSDLQFSAKKPLEQSASNPKFHSKSISHVLTPAAQSMKQSHSHKMILKKNSEE